MSKITLTNLVNLTNQTTAVNAINSNNAALTTAMDNTLSRNGTQPNTMSATLDMNSNQIINLPTPSTQNSPARLIDVVTNPTITIPGTGTSGHLVPFLDGNNTWSGTNTFNAAVTLPSNTVTNANLANVPANTAKGSIAGGAPIDLTKAQLTSLVNTATASLSGAIPAIPNNTSTFLRGDGTFASTLFGGRLAKVSNYTVAITDDGATIALGGAAYFTLTFPTASGLNATHKNVVVNEDTVRAKKVILTGGPTFILFPGQTTVVYNQNNGWLHRDPWRWRFTKATTLIVDVAGDYSHNGLASRVGNASVTLQAAG